MKKGILSVALAAWIILILFLSYQNGENTANTSFEFTKRILQIFMRKEPDYGFLLLWDGRFRLAAHFVLFFLYGIIGTMVLKEFWENFSCVAVMTLVLGIFLAVLSEVGKLLIVGRHCNLGEMGLNIIGVILGVLLIAGILWRQKPELRHNKNREDENYE